MFISSALSAQFMSCKCVIYTYMLFIVKYIFIKSMFWNSFHRFLCALNLTCYESATPEMLVGACTDVTSHLAVNLRGRGLACYTPYGNNT